MADTGFKNPTTTGSPLNQWLNPGNAFTSDDLRATELTVTEKQDYADFTLNVPSDAASIDNIVVAYEGAVGGTGGTPGVDQNDVEVLLSPDAGVNYFSHSHFIRIRGDAESREEIAGLAGRSWAASEFSNANFRCRLNYFAEDIATFQASCDHLQVKIIYTPKAPFPPFKPREKTTLTM